MSSVSTRRSVSTVDDPSVPTPPPTRGVFNRQGSQTQQIGEDAEDTMKNLRKTFAGIFGDM